MLSDPPHPRYLKAAEAPLDHSLVFADHDAELRYDTRAGAITDPTDLVELGNTFQAPNGEEVETFNNTLYGKRGSFTLTIDSIGSSNRVVGPWIFHFVVP